MTELEQTLVALGRELEIPPTPDLASSVRRRIAPRRRVRRWVSLAVAVALVGVGVAMAVPDARSSILRFFHIGAVSVERVDTLPASREATLTAGLGPARTREGAERLAGFSIILPRFESAPPTSYYARTGLIATTLEVDTQPVLLTEISGDQTGIVKKLASGVTTVEPVEVRSHFGLYLSGGEHVIVYDQPGHTNVRRLPTRFAGNVLLWAVGDRTFRLEGRIGKVSALRLARQLTR